ncbi:Leucine-rich repeat receptor-like protein kinase PXC2 [Raphanus sativus]|uniref:Leucine-rich repeat receptor-like protein kinase PXC2 n=1 Tax=Raphanus sativus TaxID=3726 RepID=A0A6J0MFV4_RAPSA|nr:leucine-rich repeat receptor-like protein kinase PXC2 [Raphanus sativus]KAJ4911491.1 Leucine-rich repeat receptor-like protein kinase PXC2 [Raphanus sativus]
MSLHDALVSLLLFFLAVSFTSGADPTFNDDVLGLIVFKSGLEDPHSNLASWNSEDYDPCSWAGCVCDPATNQVTELRLDGFSLSGHIGRGLLRLRSLQTLVLSNNNLTGALNSDLTHLGTLQLLDFSGNNLSGRIPDAFFEQCGSLRSVSLARNSLNGPLPASLSYCSTLTHLNLSSNHLSGRLPRELWLLRSLNSLDLSDNFLQGDLPDGIGGLYDLRRINLSKNWFSGELPSDVGACSSLRWIDLSDNYFSGSLPVSMKTLGGSCRLLRLRGNSLVGEIPEWIGEVVNLETLDLSANNFSGKAPSSLGNLVSLKELNLSTNFLSGEIPQSISNCSSLVSLDVSRNSFTGDVLKWMMFSQSSLHKRSRNVTFLPSNVGFLQGLRLLDLSSNRFSGEIPSNVWILTSLVHLNISDNSLFGSVPGGIGGLKLVEILDLSSNLLNGTLPSEIGGAVSLKQLNLQRNHLTGQIPAMISNCSALNTIDLSENKLSGAIPGSIGSLSNLQYIDLSRNNLSGSLPKQVEKLTHLVTFNISHNNITGELPAGGFFNAIPLSAVTGNPSLCGSVVNRSCLSVHPKPIVLNPNSSNPATGPPLGGQIRKSVLSISALIAIGAAAFIAVGVVAVTLLNVHAKSSVSRHDAAAAAAALAMSVGDTFSCSPSKDQEFGKLVMFSGEADVFDTTGANALLNKDCEVGRGGFGVVYKTSLQDGRPVAVKKLTVSGLIKSQEEFEREMRKLGKLRHRNVVEIKGYYWTQSLQLLIHEFVSGGSLYRHLHGDECACLTWRERFSIILGIARGLAYLHGSNITHYNLKATNVLIDAETGEAKVSDFGLARLLASALDRCVLSGKVQSALGYTAPEFACRTVKITEKCDVYGFGILVLEVVTGKRPVEYAEDDVMVLCETVREGLEEGRVEECVDGRLRRNFPAEEAIPVIKLGLVCASQVPSNRPEMEEVVKILELIQCPSQEFE